MISKRKLIDDVAKQSNLSKEDTKKLVNATIEAITYFVSKGEAVNILNFGTFQIREYKSRTRFNIHLGENSLSEKHKLPHFKPSNDLKRKANKEL